jgi:hypothetical protein
MFYWFYKLVGIFYSVKFTIDFPDFVKIKTFYNVSEINIEKLIF